MQNTTAGEAPELDEKDARIEELERQIATYRRTAQENGGSSVDAIVAQDQIRELRARIALAVAAEREACILDVVKNYGIGPSQIAAAIRARKI